MNVAISGYNGFIGTKLSEYLAGRGNYIIGIGRQDFYDKHRLQILIDESDVIINLAGETIAKRWTRKHKQLILNSRIDCTRALVDAANKSIRPTIFISASAVGIYKEDINIHTDNSKDYNDDFLGSVCKQWEAETLNLRSGIRRVITRFGIVLSPDGGILNRLLRLAKAGVGVVVGDGEQRVSWIDARDLMLSLEYIIWNRGMHGPVNMIAPTITRQKDMAEKILHFYHPKYPTITIPRFLIKLILGESAVLFTADSAVTPLKLIKSNFKFCSNDINEYFLNVASDNM